MKARFSFLSAAILSFALCAPASAADLTWTYTPTISSTGAQTIDGITITPTYTWKTGAYFNNSSGLQIGKTGSNVVSVAYAFTSFPDDVKSIAITGKTSSGNSGITTVSATIGTESFTGTASLTSTEKTITLTAPEGAQTGNLAIMISNPNGDAENNKSQAVHVKSIVVTYKDPSAVGLQQLAMPTGLASSNIGYFGFSFSWNSVLNATNGYTVTLSPAAGNVSVNGTTATVTGLAEGATYTVSVVANGDGTGTDNSEAATLEVTTMTAPAITQPDPTATSVSSSSVTVSWTAQNDASFSVRAWTLVPADIATEDFAGYAADGTAPDGWTFDHAEAYTGSTYAHYPVGFKSVSGSAVSPDFGGNISSLTFQLRSISAEGSFIVSAAPRGTDNWTVVTNYTSAAGTLKTETKTIQLNVESGYSKLKFEFVRSGGSAAFGSLIVVGTGVGKQPSYLTGYGPDAAAAGATSVTISNPVAGETNYVEVTATGLSGRTESKTISVAVPAASYPAVISVK